jgi:hypothetical protein
MRLFASTIFFVLSFIFSSIAGADQTVANKVCEKLANLPKRATARSGAELRLALSSEIETKGLFSDSVEAHASLMQAGFTDKANEFAQNPSEAPIGTIFLLKYKPGSCYLPISRKYGGFAIKCGSNSIFYIDQRSVLSTKKFKELAGKCMSGVVAHNGLSSPIKSEQKKAIITLDQFDLHQKKNEGEVLH